MTNITRSFFKGILDDKDWNDLFNWSVMNETGNASPSNILDDLLLRRYVLKQSVANTISSAGPILKHGDNGIIFPNKINILQGPVAAYKSQFAGSICSAFLSKPGVEIGLGFHTKQNCPSQLLYVDTERSPKHEFARALHQIVAKAGYLKEETFPDSFSYFPLAEINREYRFEVLRDLIRCKHAEPYYHLFIILDLSSGLIPDSNNPEQVKKLINLINDAIANYNCTFLCIIDEDPDSEKTRGHFESELMNIASSVMQLLYDKRTSLIELKFLKPSNTEKPASIFFKYAEGLVLAEDWDEFPW